MNKPRVFNYRKYEEAMAKIKLLEIELENLQKVIDHQTNEVIKLRIELADIKSARRILGNVK